MNRIKHGIIALAAILGVLSVPLATAPVGAVIDPQAEACQGTGGTGGAGGCSGNSTQDDLIPVIKRIVNVFLYILGAVAIIVIIIGGLRYITSNGDPSKVKGAKDTILYAVIGLIIAILAYAIVNFVIGAFK